MTTADVTFSGRYVLDRRWNSAAAGERSLGTDRKLQRRVLLWVVEAPPSDPQRTELLALARRCSRLSYAGCLQVLDVVEEPERLSVVLQSPDAGAPPEEAALAHRLPALMAAAVVLDVAGAVEDAAAYGLHAERVPLAYLHLDRGGELWLDPVGIFRADAADARPSNPAGVLCDLLDTLLLPDAGEPGADQHFDPGAPAARRLVERWRSREEERSDDGGLALFVAELRMLSPARHPFVPPSAPPPAAAAVGPPVPAAVRTDQAPRLEPAIRSPEVAQPAPGTPAPRDRPSAPPRWLQAYVRLNRPLAALLLVAALLVAAWPLASGLGIGQGGAEGTSTPEATGTPTPVPADRVVVGLTAQEASRVQVTVDGRTAFNGVMQPGQSGTWEGGQRIQVYTDRGQTMLITINGYALGPYSAAMGHPDWNRIDFGFWPGWKPSGTELQLVPADDNSGPGGGGGRRGGDD